MAHWRKPPYSVVRLYNEPSKMSIGRIKKMSITIKNNFVFTTIEIKGCKRFFKANSIDGLFEKIEIAIKEGK